MAIKLKETITQGKPVTLEKQDYSNEFRQIIDIEIEQGSGGLREIIHDETLKGKGTKDDPLGIAQEILDKLPKYLSVERLGNYIFKTTFDSIPEYDPSIAYSVDGGCTSFVREGKLYRNFDWKYDNTAEFMVVCKEFQGMASIIGMNDGDLDIKKIEQLPYHLVDGVNTSGIKVSTHILYNDWQYTGAGSKDKNIMLLPYYILSNLHNISDINTVLGNYLANIEIPAVLANAGYLLQFVVTDGSTTYALLPPEDATGSYEIQNITDNPKLTNFRWVADETVERVNLQTRPTGVERWNEVATSELSDLRFTKCYEAATRLSEFIGIDDTTKDSTDAELEDIYNRAHAIYVDGYRGDGLWQTVHSIVFSGDSIEHLWVQEDWGKDYICASKSELETEKESRIVGDETLDEKINAEQQARQAGDSALGTRIDNEITRATDAENSLSDRITANTNAISAETTAREQADEILQGQLDSLSTHIDAETQNRIDADNALSDRITTNSDAISDINDELDTYGNIVTHNVSEFATAEQGEKADSALQASDVINDTQHTDSNKPLSANMGKSLQDQIDNLQGRGKYLSIWDCTTGLAMDEPPVNPYTIETGSYFIVGKIASAGGTNYRPNGGIYDKDVPSTTVETGEVKVNDTYFYDGTQWRLLDVPEKDVAFSSLAGSPYDNTNLANALDVKQNVLVAGNNITIDNNNVISAVDTTYTAGKNIEIVDNVISSNATSNFFRGLWANWASVPSSYTGYPEDPNGNRRPLLNDKIVVTDASDYNEPNLYTEDGITEGYALDENGQPISWGSMRYTKLISIDSLDFLTVNWKTGGTTGRRRLHAYDENGTWIQEIGSATITPISGSIPSGTKYIRLSFAKTDTDVVINRSGYTNLEGSYVFSYNYDAWGTLGKQGWKPEYPLGGGKVDDVKVNGVSVVTDKIANIDLSGKQDTLVSGTNIKTINGDSVLGSGDITISAPTYTASNGVKLVGTDIQADGTTMPDPVLTNVSTETGGTSIIVKGATASNYTQTTILGKGSSSNTYGSTIIGYNNVAYGNNTVCIGNTTQAGTSTSKTGNYSIAIGYSAKVANNSTSNSSVSIGYASSSNGNYNVVLGGGAQASVGRNVVIGYQAGATSSNYATAVGDGAKANGQYSISLGSSASTSSSNTIAIGASAQANASGAIQIGQGANTTSNTLQVKTYPLMDLSTGKIYNDRLDLSGKQDVLTAGEGIDITNNVISATGGGGNVDDVTVDGVSVVSDKIAVFETATDADINAMF